MGWGVIFCDLVDCVEFMDVVFFGEGVSGEVVFC